MLTPDNLEIETETVADRRGKDAQGNLVLIKGTKDAIHLHGWDLIWKAGERKYARGDYEQLGEVRLILIEASDCGVEEGNS